MGISRFGYEISLPLGIVVEGYATAEDGKLSLFTVCGNDEHAEEHAAIPTWLVPRTPEQRMTRCISQAIEDKYAADIADTGKRIDWRAHAPVVI